MARSAARRRRSGGTGRMRATVSTRCSARCRLGALSWLGSADRLSAGLLSLGISAGDMTAEGRDKVAILSKNRPEWVVLDLAVQQIGAILTPIYPTINVNELEFVEIMK